MEQQEVILFFTLKGFSPSDREVCPSNSEEVRGAICGRENFPVPRPKVWKAAYQSLGGGDIPHAQGSALSFMQSSLGTLSDCKGDLLAHPA
jgi:hypothetical protein